MVAVVTIHTYCKMGLDRKANFFTDPLLVDSCLVYMTHYVVTYRFVTYGFGCCTVIQYIHIVNQY
jgi:hypothetical protein